MAGTGSVLTMKHAQVIENFIKEGKAGSGTYVKASEDLLYSSIPQHYRPFGNLPWRAPLGQTAPLAVRLESSDLLANGAALASPMNGHQAGVLRQLERSGARFSVVPFHSIVAAWTDGKTRNWNDAPIPLQDLKREVEVIVPSAGERWKEITEKDDKGREHTRQIHTLGDSVVRVHERFYVSAVDETGVGYGMYFLAELLTDRPPASLDEALDCLKPQVVREAEARGSNVRRQGEWFAIPMKLLTSELMRDVERGVAVYRQKHVLGRDGHHQLEEAVIYRAGSRKGEVYARGQLQHTNEEHRPLDLGMLRWHLVVHSIQGASYTLTGRDGVAQFD